MYAEVQSSHIASSTIVGRASARRRRMHFSVGLILRYRRADLQKNVRRNEIFSHDRHKARARCASLFGRSARNTCW